MISPKIGLMLVALRKESVDRNFDTMQIVIVVMQSLSARRAWIEIAQGRRVSGCALVALRKESVDRNLWWGVRKAVGSLVALRKESVDRNTHDTQTMEGGIIVALRKESVDRNRQRN